MGNGFMMLLKIKKYLDDSKSKKELDYEWAKVHAGSLVLKDPSMNLDEIKHLLSEGMKEDIQNKVDFNYFSPTEFKETKFIIIHKEKIKSTQNYFNFESKFETEIGDKRITKKAENWIIQFPFFDWKMYALKLLSNITYLNEDKIDKKLEDMTKFMSGLDNYVISNIEGIEKSSNHLFYPLNKSLKIHENFILSQDLISSDDRSIVFIDDMVGTGNQVINYIKKLKRDGKIGDQKLYYFAIVGLKDGINNIENSRLFEKVEANIVISNAAFDTGFIFTAEESGIAKDMAYSIGKQLTERKNKIDPLGYKNSGTLVFF
ncbi:MAG: phosphoribosyltransferase-like protein, partial [Methanosarcinaceae archaeon]